MAKKYYAVRKGKVVGLFDSWDACKDVIQGVSGAEYKGFSSEVEARQYLSGVDKKEEVIDKPVNAGEVNIYTKCSCKKDGCGVGVYLEAKEVCRQFYGLVHCNDNVSGNIVATLYGVELAVALGYRCLNIVSDYQGVGCWYSGEWKAKMPIAKNYISTMKAIEHNNSVSFKFLRHKGTSLANTMASRALKFRDEIDVSKILDGSLAIQDAPLYR